MFPKDGGTRMRVELCIQIVIDSQIAFALWLSVALLSRQGRVVAVSISIVWLIPIGLSIA